MNGCRCYCCRDDLHDRPWTAVIYLLVILGFVFLAQGCGNGVSRDPFQDAAGDAAEAHGGTPSRRIDPLPRLVSENPVDASLERPPVDAAIDAAVDPMPDRPIDQMTACALAGLTCPPACTCSGGCSPFNPECFPCGAGC